MIKYLKNKSGASIVIVIILSIIFLALGVSVLTSASVSVGASAKNRENKQLYYYSKSAADTINSSMQVNNGIGYAIADAIAGMMISNDKNITTEMVLDSEILLKKGNINYEGVVYKDVKIKLSSIAQSKTSSTSGSTVTETFSINIPKVTISFVTVYRGLEYNMNMEYSFTANGKRVGTASAMPPIVTWDSMKIGLKKVYQGG